MPSAQPPALRTSTPRTSAFVYPWDVVGDPDAAARIAGLGVHRATLASAYHSTRALTPRHPAHRVVTAGHAAVLYPPAASRWAGRRLRPFPAGDWAPGDAHGEASTALAAAGLDVHTWVILAHSSRLGAEHPDTSVVNAYGDRYPWAPCIGRPEVREYLVDLAAEAAVRPGAGGTELESCGWYGYAHPHAHDKVGGVAFGDAAQYLMSLCFCSSCRDGYAVRGQDPAALAARVREALAPVWSGDSPGESLPEEDWPGATLAYRAETARAFQEEVVAAVRAAAPAGFRVVLHADPAVHHCGANAGVDPEHVLSVADGVVVPCAGGPGLLPAFAKHAGPHSVLAANLGVVSGMGGSPATLAADTARAIALGANELRLYHAGLASDADLRLVRRELASL